MKRALTKPLKTPCRSCPFREDGIKLDPIYFGKIQVYLIEGDNHICHTDAKSQRVCRGGFNYQLEMWHRMGRIDAPTQPALVAKMRELGIEPSTHLCKPQRPLTKLVKFASYLWNKFKTVLRSSLS